VPDTAPAPLSTVPQAPNGLTGDETTDPEVDALWAIQAAMEPLAPEARARVLAWTAARYPAGA
jgi:hypothetical protein